MEFKLWSLLLLIADRGGLRPPARNAQGYVLDAGANDGSSAEMMASAFESKGLRVMAIEPLSSNVRVATRRAERATNLEVIRGGLGATNGSVGWYPWYMDKRRGDISLQINSWSPQQNVGGVAYPIFTIDALFGGEAVGRSLVLAHLDLEGCELDALSAANATIARDRPIVTVETYPLFMPHKHNAIMAYFEEHSYDVYTVKELVGHPTDGRNRVCVPREDRHLRWVLGHWFHMT
jgi:FkbM family methyltransferase